MNNYKHGHAKTKTRTYETWRNMKKRCNYSGCKAYPYYGGRGITYCDRWENFLDFLKDMGERPQGMTLERIDVEGNYDKNNCRWATLDEQSMNRRNTIWVFHGGKLISVREAAKDIGKCERTIRWREQTKRESQEIVLDSLPEGLKI